MALHADLPEASPDGSLATSRSLNAISGMRASSLGCPFASDRWRCTISDGGTLRPSRHRWLPGLQRHSCSCVLVFLCRRSGVCVSRLSASRGRDVQVLVEEVLRIVDGFHAR